ncbi:MAG: hypothetical protein NTZ93_01670 [Candidatus Beckwithbacteria bacterium]|nr:hypothetical protein [Candidatus Beckwithbacteria bacterium]
MKTRWQQKREKDSLKQAVKYLVLVLVLLFILVRFGVPGLIKMAGFLGSFNKNNQTVEQQDKLPLLPPTMDFLPEATNSSEINISGTAQAGNTVKLFLKGISLKETIVTDDGNFTFINIHLADGANEIYTESNDNQGGVSEPSVTQSVTLDTTAPSLEISNPQDDQRFFDKDSPIKVSGKAEARADLTINNRFIFVKDDGSFETTLNLNSGDNQIDFVVKDNAGNETKKSLTVNYTP